jgi:hypothetical protein
MKCRISHKMAGAISALLFVSITIGVGNSFSQEFLMGKVLSVDFRKKEIELASQTPMTRKESDGKGVTVLVQSNNTLPGCVVIGAYIRIWGKRLSEDSNTFVANDIRGCRGGGCADPTGVRSRLSIKGKKQHRGCSSDEDSTDVRPDSQGHPAGRGWHGGKGNSDGGRGGGR